VHDRLSHRLLYLPSRVGTWSSETGYTACAQDPTMQSALTGGCQYNVIWGTDGNVMPLDRAAPKV
jgi:hypothetical protein